MTWLIYGALAYAVYRLATGSKSSTQIAKGAKRAKRSKSRPGRAASEPHAVLGVSADASAAEIRRAYQERIHAYHPDRVAHAAPELQRLAEERTKQINAAYAALQRDRNLP